MGVFSLLMLLRFLESNGNTPHRLSRLTSRSGNPSRSVIETPRRAQRCLVADKRMRADLRYHSKRRRYVKAKGPCQRDDMGLFSFISGYGFSGVTVTPLTDLLDSISFLIRPCDCGAICLIVSSRSFPASTLSRIMRGVRKTKSSVLLFV